MSAKETALPRRRAGVKTDLRAGRAPLQPAAAPSPETDSPPAATAKTKAPARKSKQSQPAPTPAPTSHKRPAGSSRIALDVPRELAESFRQRAGRSTYRFSQSEALTAALALLEELDDETYEKTVLSHRKH